ncbi:hypothetical protein Pint_25628 [Pistacia integerrima]|uniref:Uncharacterized protein n=1 Tax=Pistacia integerrima TaxID=434235 RepID=A0ACC0YAU0_9ROSI|nr:hypothetical protein Pint_25628 [Pistacia integerrima]
MKQYKCLTSNSSLASAIYVPFYAGLNVGRHLWGFNTSVRDSSAFDMVKWLKAKPEWKRMWGRDHFFVAGRIAWDFRRRREIDSDWGNKLMSLPESMNMTMLTIESISWSNEFAIPYPTYFHPSSEREHKEEESGGDVCARNGVVAVRLGWGEERGEDMGEGDGDGEKGEDEVREGTDCMG